MFEKKKKKNDERPFWLTVLHWTAGLLLVLIGLVIAGIFFVWSIPFGVPATTAPVYPAPPETVSVIVGGMVMDTDGKLLNYRRMHIEGRFNDVDVMGFDMPTVYGTGVFSGTFDVQHPSSGCVWGSIEIKEGVWQKFEYGLGNIQWGAYITIKIVVKENGIDFTAIASPSDIKPALAPNPVMQLQCDNQEQ